ncbi:AAA family ATPase [Micromonospora sp. ATA51]|uniref:AAA family ATPase n=1 Tax=Micromonospora sp. ATA51 TaxID=2806098 RepID=UPI001A40293C|nr:AAA family ATPase [Micromonospora sp. ATA51]MBM0224812.1 AAA family ATPase [Micromonospora sp. ATA51]
MCDFDAFTVITGANGAGKSNLADGMDFIAHTYREGLEMAVMRAGGYDSIAYRRSTRARAPISIEVDGEISLEELANALPAHLGISRTKLKSLGSLTFHHSFAFRAAGRAIGSDFSIQHDRMDVSNKSGSLISVERGSDKNVSISMSDRLKKAVSGQGALADALQYAFYPFIDQSVMRLFQERTIPATDLMMRQFGASSIGVWRLARSIGHARVFQLNPQQCRSTGVPTPNASLSRYGENLPSVAHYLQKHRPESWEKIVNAMRAVVPRLEGIQITHTEDRRLALQFKERFVGRSWNTNELSDGTIQAFALFTAIFDGRSPTLVVEEPENSLHPWVLRQFIDLCRADDSKQIILTTHSPVVLDYVPHESLRLMWLRNGKSHYVHMSKLNSNVLELWKSGQVRVFDTYDSGLFPEAVPQYYAADQGDQVQGQATLFEADDEELQ